MADNYLERRMDDYRSGRLAPRKSSSRTSLPADALVMSYPPMKVLLWAPEGSEWLEPMVKALRSVGLKVAFCAPSSAQNTALGQRLGARFYPSSLARQAVSDDIDQHWGGVDLTLSFDGKSIGGEVIEFMPIAGSDPEALCRAVAFMLHPDNHQMLASGCFLPLRLAE